MKKRILSILLAAAMIAGILSGIPVLAAENDPIPLTDSTDGQTIGTVGTTTYYVVNSNTSCTATTLGVSGLSIANGATVHIYVPAGVTLTCRGAAADGIIGAGAGILLPADAVLYLDGEGTVKAIGGNAGDGKRGEPAESGTITVDNTELGGYIIHEGGSYYGGKGGDGGFGGGGAGAGVGTAGGNGGQGGKGGKGDGGDINENHLNFEAGKDGEDGHFAAQMGELHTQLSLTLNATGGNFGPGGRGGDYGYNRFDCNYNSSWDYNHTAGGAGGGAGGGGGGAGASVGQGGQGGGGGGGGAGAGAIYRKDSGYYNIKTKGGGGGSVIQNVQGGGRGESGSQADNYVRYNTDAGYWSGYPYYPDGTPGGKGGVGGASSVHIHDFSDTVCECGKVEFLIDENNVLLEYNGYAETPVVPDGVTKIGLSVFAYKPIKGVVLPDTVTVIDQDAFRNTQLTSITIPASVTEIGWHAFAFCDSLTDVTFTPNASVTSFSNGAFRNCGFETFTIPESVQEIETDAFLLCRNLKRINLNWTSAEKIVRDAHAFGDIDPNCVLVVPTGTKALYEADQYWREFAEIIEVTDPTGAQDIKSTTTALTDGDWFVSGTVSVSSALTVSGSVSIHLADDSVLNADHGIVLENGSTLTVFAQSDGEHMGALRASGEDDAPGIGVTDVGAMADVVIKGGNISAQGGFNGAGIGGGSMRDGIRVTVYGGTVDARGGENAAGIGSGRGYSKADVKGGTFVMYGGNVTAQGGSNSAGIGGGDYAGGADVTVNGGTLSAFGANACAAIGRGDGTKANGSFTVGEYHAAITAGTDAEHAAETSAADYDTARNAYVHVAHVHSFDSGVYKINDDGTHAQKCEFCEDYDAPEEHDFVGSICVCGAVLDYSVWINGRQFTDDIKWRACGNGHAELDKSTIPYTLTLYDVQIAGVHTDGTYAGAIYSTGSLNVVLVGSSTIVPNTDDLQDAVYAGICVDGDLTISGDGDLTVTAENEKFDGIFTQGSFTSEANGTLTIRGGDEAIDTESTVTLGGTGDVSLTGGEYGIQIDGFSGGSLILSGSGNVSVAAAAENAVILWGEESKVLLNGTAKNVTFTAAEGKKAIRNGDTENSPVAGSSLAGYAVTGAADSAFVSYSKKNFTFDSVSLVLSGELGLNFYTKIDDPSLCQDGYMLFEIGNKGETQRVALADLTPEADGRYVFRCSVNALQMADTITVSFRCGETVEGPKTISVAEYIRKVVEKHGNDDSDPTVVLAKSIVNYGHYAQLALQQTHGFTLGRDYAAVGEYRPVSVRNYSELADFAAVRTGSIAQITKVTRSLSLENKTDLNLYFTVEDGYVPTVSVTDKDGDTAAATLEKQTDGRYLLVIPSIAAHELGDTFTVSVDGGAMTIRVSALSYAYSVLSADKSGEQKCAVSALYEYYNAAIAYRNAQ